MAQHDYQTLYPTFLKLTDRSVLLVGGGNIATTKLGPLVAAGARVTVVAPEIDDRILAAAELSPIRIVRRAFTVEDFDAAAAWFVVSAATPDVNAAVADAAERRRVFVIAVDDLKNATAYGAGTFRRAGVTVAVSTEGRAPALAGLLREGLEALVPEEINEWVETARTLKSGWKGSTIPHAARRPLLLQAINRLYLSRGVVPVPTDGVAPTNPVNPDTRIAAAHAADPALLIGGAR
jgi:uroporphyrin-III C-methyltransferase/precorrin-2 dehydrogenase/sirohydrochlorin ferrochelatase